LNYEQILESEAENLALYKSGLKFNLEVAGGIYTEETVISII